MKKRNIFFVALITLTINAMAQNIVRNSEVEVSSPDGNQTIVFYQQKEKDNTLKEYYRVNYKKQPVIIDSRVGLELDNRIWELALAKKIERDSLWMDNLEYVNVERGEHSSEWCNPFGERSTVKDIYHSAILHFAKRDGSNYGMDIEVRAYNEGVAFRFYFPEHPSVIYHKVTEDLTEYSFEPGTYAWSAEWAQAPYNRLPIDRLKNPAERALTIELPNGLWTALTDADVDDWCLTKFKSSSEKKNTLKSIMYSSVDFVTYFATPWKVIITAESPGDLVNHNDIILNLNPANQITDAQDWVKPGKIMREASITTEGGLACIDFAAIHHLSYILFDWKWYWPCTSKDGDATKVIDELDLKRVIEYGKEKGIGVWLYVNHHALEKQAEILFPLLHQWGVVGVKFGFVEFASHRWATWLHEMVRLAAKNHLMVNIHDEFRPSGYSRTYPNLLSQEGIRGNEEWPDATHNTTLAFTRMINGAADYTICYYDQRLKNTHAHQLALSLIFFSPLQTLFWYDTPDRAHAEPELEWFDSLPTVFDDSKILSGAPEKSVVTMRRKGENYWLGVITNNESSHQEIKLDFLKPGVEYIASVYTDGSNEIKTKTHVKCSYFKVNSHMKMRLNLISRGGAAIKFVPAAKKHLKGIKSYHNEWL